MFILEHYLQNQLYRWWEGKEEGISNYSIRLIYGENSGNWKMKNYLTLYGELDWEEAKEF
jgi:hypothetical protein